jgi:glucosamine-6-phosphate deaminase
MNVQIYSTRQELGNAAAQHGADAIRKSISETGQANIVLATGLSQIEMLDALTREAIDWSRVRAFHLDEYIGLSSSHSASFRRYLKERFVERVGGIGEFHYIGGEDSTLGACAVSPEEECARLGNIIQREQIDVAFIGIGENGHIAFNDPPADFTTKEPYIVVDLNEECRKQQMGEGWFSSIDEVPHTAVTMSISQVLNGKLLIVSVPDVRKAEAVRCTVEGEINPLCPASVLQRHPNCIVFLDSDSSSLITTDRE